MRVTTLWAGDCRLKRRQALQARRLQRYSSTKECADLRAWEPRWNSHNLERYTAQPVGSARKTVVVAQSSLECQMSKRKPATASKHARSPKITAKAHRANQAVVRSPKDSRLRSLPRVQLSRRPSVITNQNMRLPVLRIRRQPCRMSANRR